MAKNQPSTAVSSKPSPAQGANGSAPARGQGAAPPPPSFTEVQQSADSALGDLAALLAGVSPDDDAGASPAAADKPASEPTPKAPKDVVPPPPSSDDEEPAVLHEEDAAVLSDADDEDDEDDDGAADTAGKQKLSKEIQDQLFKYREQKRELKAQLEAKSAEITSLQTRLDDMAKAPASTPGATFDGIWKDAKNEADITSMAGTWQQRLEFLEDNEEGFFEQDASGQDVERDSKWIKQQMRAIRRELSRVPDLKETLRAQRQRQETAEASAKKKYPFVFNSSSKYQPLVAEVLKEHPELHQAPDKPLAIGRLVIAKLVESGQMVLTPKVKTAAASSAAAAKPEPATAARRDKLPAVSAAPASRSTNGHAPLMDSRSNNTLSWAEGLLSG